MPPNPAPTPFASRPPRFLQVLLGACAGGLAWGIRGQYGHETGAMLAGLLLSLTLALLAIPSAPLVAIARTVAWTTVAFGIGGSMTYGQTIGLTQDAPLIGNFAAWRWGMLGLAIKGGIWIGFGGLFLGLGLNTLTPNLKLRIEISSREILSLWLGVFALYFVGVYLLNEPFDPAQKILPKIYFSDDWRWEPNSTLKPRRECWGGLLFAWIGAWLWAACHKRAVLAKNLALWAFAGGAIGFPAGQCLQSAHAWFPEFYKTGVWATLDPHMNWWNWMETTFGFIMGGAIAMGIAFAPSSWFSPDPNPPNHQPAPSLSNPPSILVEIITLTLHVALLIGAEFSSIRWMNALYDPGLILAFVPLVMIAQGRLWPFFLALPITLLPIAGKTLRNLVYQRHVAGPVTGWLIFLIFPLMLASVAALRAIRIAQSQNHCPAAHPLSPASMPALRFALASCTLLYFGLNFAFFDFPWPWLPWTSRTPNAIAFTTFTLALLAAARWTPNRTLTPKN